MQFSQLFFVFASLSIAAVAQLDPELIVSELPACSVCFQQGPFLFIITPVANSSDIMFSAVTSSGQMRLRRHPNLPLSKHDAAV
jgi:hypothetical protein